ncbi:13400_t:CDS:2, partial [Racocetra fulgida]
KIVVKVQTFNKNSTFFLEARALVLKKRKSENYKSKNKPLASNEKDANRWFDMIEEEQTRRDTMVLGKQVEKAALTESNIENEEVDEVTAHINIADDEKMETLSQNDETLEEIIENSRNDNMSQKGLDDLIRLDKNNENVRKDVSSVEEFFNESNNQIQDHNPNNIESLASDDIYMQVQPQLYKANEKYIQTDNGFTKEF